MSFFHKKKEVDFIQAEKAIDKEIAIGNELAEKARAKEEPNLKQGEVRVRNLDPEQKPTVSEETSKERNRRKFKDASGIISQGEPNNYPTFTAYYLGRIPTSREYGRDAVEGPVDQICKLRDKQKLPKVTLIFDTEGLSFKAVSTSFFSKGKSKKDGIDISIPLHHITYGIGSEGHPRVFACIARLASDERDVDPADTILMLHAFLCEKEETAQQITYWQLQAYIEAYEELKRKKILRNRRKQALGSRTNPSSMMTSHPNAVDPKTPEKIQPQPIYGTHPPPLDLIEDLETDKPDPIYSQVKPKKGYKVKNKGYVKSKPSNGYSPEERLEENGNIVKDYPDESPTSSEPPSPTRLSRSLSVTSDDSQDGSTRGTAFERRISELNTLVVEMDAEKLKKLMITNHAHLARDIYFNKQNPKHDQPNSEEDYDV